MNQFDADAIVQALQHISITLKSIDQSLMVLTKEGNTVSIAQILNNISYNLKFASKDSMNFKR